MGSDQREPDGGDQSVTGLRFRVVELRRVPGAHEHDSRTVSPDPAAVGEVSVDPGPVDVTVDLEVVSGGVRASGSVDFAWSAPCRRCLEEATGLEKGEFNELFVDDPDSYVGDPGAESEPLQIVDGWIDLGGSVRDAMLLGLPLAPLCDQNCAGPDPEDHPVGLEGSPGGARGKGEGEPALDPRWSALSELDLGDEDADG